MQSERLTVREALAGSRNRRMSGCTQLLAVPVHSILGGLSAGKGRESITLSRLHRRKLEKVG